MTENAGSQPPAKRHRGAELLGSLTFAVAARVRDISLTGLAVECPQRLQPRRSFRVRLGDTAGAVELQARVVWCFLKETRADAHGEHRPTYRAGLEFEDVLSERARELLHFLDANALVTLETRICGRFDLRVEEIVHLSSEIEFQAVSISRTGLLIETEVGPEVGTACAVELPGGAARLRLPAHVAYARRLDEGDTERAELGLEFGELTDEQRSSIGELMARLESADSPPDDEP